MYDKNKLYLLKYLLKLLSNDFVNHRSNVMTNFLSAKVVSFGVNVSRHHTIHYIAIIMKCLYISKEY